jgi:hypothetical protein
VAYILIRTIGSVVLPIQIYQEESMNDAQNRSARNDRLLSNEHYGMKLIRQQKLVVLDSSAYISISGSGKDATDAP